MHEDHALGGTTIDTSVEKQNWPRMRLNIGEVSPPIAIRMDPTYTSMLKVHAGPMRSPTSSKTSLSQTETPIPSYTWNYQPPVTRNGCGVPQPILPILATRLPCDQNVS